jgi:cytochrome c oxidase subunit IV
MSDPATDVALAGGAPAVPEASGGVLVAGGGHLPAHVHPHPTPRQYVMIAVVLVVVTAVEITTSYLNTGHTNLIILALFLLAALKFFLVAAWYMHMKVDQPFFRRIFVVGMVVAGVVYGCVMLMFSSTVLKS